MDPILTLLITLLVLWIIYSKIFKKGNNGGNDYKEKTYPQTPSYFFSYRFNDESIMWCADFLGINRTTLTHFLQQPSSHYNSFRISKRSGGCRNISAPSKGLQSIQQTIYNRILRPVNIHPAATGFRPKKSIVDNVKPHLGNKQVLKVDIQDFFGSIKKYMVVEVFENIGYPTNIAKIFAELCTLKKKLPQGAPTSPALSNIVAYEMDMNLTALAAKYKLTYTRYADDLTFSGEEIPFETILPEIEKILRAERFVLQKKKTKLLGNNKRKIITGISISSGKKLTIPKAKKREMRQKVHYILTKGLDAHQRHVGSKDPAYLKRTIGYLNYWHAVEPDNQYVIRSIEALNKLRRQ